jgi:hypothetical protein
MVRRDARDTLVYRSLDWAYDRAVGGVGRVESAESLANEYLDAEGTIRARVDRLIRWQATKSGMSGFVGGVGGLALLPVALPVNLTSVLYLQLRMIAAIAHMGGHDVKTDRVRTLAYACLLGNAAKDVVKEAGVQLGTGLTRHALERISARVISRLNERVAQGILARFGARGAAHLSRIAPLAGGLVGGSLDAAATYAIGHVARRAFVRT